MKKSNSYSPEVRERAVRMVLENLKDYPSEWAAIESIAPKIGCVPQTLHGWIRKHQTDIGHRPGQTTEERERIKALERENRETAQSERDSAPVSFSEGDSTNYQKSAARFFLTVDVTSENGK